MTAETDALRLVPVEPTEADKQNARRLVRDALKAGRLVRADKCARCDRPNRKCSDGRSYIHAHHHDYSKPLDVEWICADCHRAETPLPETMGKPVPGSRNGASKLNEADIPVIRSSPLGCLRLSRVYGVDKKTIQRVRNRQLWNHV